jgi:ABC-2 type transport system permease protein
MNAEFAEGITVRLRRFKSSKIAVARFIARRTVRGACLWGLVFGLYVYSSAIGFLDISPTTAGRERIVGALINNTGLKALFGEPHNVYAVGGFVDWRNLSIVALVGAIWGLMTATKIFRGEEDAGRWELFLTGQTTSWKATLQALLGLSTALLSMFLLTSIVVFGVGRRPEIGFTLTQSMMFGATMVSSVGIFLAIGAFASQLMPTRAAAGSLGAAILGVFFLLRAAADLTPTVHWLIYLTPFGWAELVRPLSGTDVHVVWLLPIAGLICVVSGAAIFLAGRRDLGESIVPDRTTARPHTLLLNFSVTAAIRFTQGIVISWLLAIVVFGIFFGSLAKSAGQAFSSSQLVKKLGADLVHQVQVTGAKVYIGFIFFLIMTLIMISVAAAMGKVRDEEAEGYLDNLLVRSTGRAVWLWGRVAIIATTTVLAGLAAAGAIWVSSASQHTGLAIHSLLLAGINAVAPAFLLLGIGVFVFSFFPRFTSAALYGFIIWSFLLQLVGSILNLNHWLLDSSALYHIALAPSVDPNWTPVCFYASIAILLTTIGVWRFCRRDLVVL